MDRYEAELPAELADVAEHLTTHRHDPQPLELDALKQRALSQATRVSGARRGLMLRSKLVALSLTLGLVLSGGAAGVVAGQSDGIDRSAVIAQYEDTLPEVEEGGTLPETEEADPVVAPSGASGGGLPFTGLELGLALLVGGGMIGAGLTARQLVRRREI